MLQIARTPDELRKLACAATDPIEWEIPADDGMFTVLYEPQMFFVYAGACDMAGARETIDAVRSALKPGACPAFSTGVATVVCKQPAPRGATHGKTCDHAKEVRKFPPRRGSDAQFEWHFVPLETLTLATPDGSRSAHELVDCMIAGVIYDPRSAIRNPHTVGAAFPAVRLSQISEFPVDELSLTMVSRMYGSEWYLRIDKDNTPELWSIRSYRGSRRYDGDDDDESLCDELSLDGLSFDGSSRACVHPQVEDIIEPGPMCGQIYCTKATRCGRCECILGHKRFMHKKYALCEGCAPSWAKVAVSPRSQSDVLRSMGAADLAALLECLIVPVCAGVRVATDRTTREMKYVLTEDRPRLSPLDYLMRLPPRVPLFPGVRFCVWPFDGRERR